MYDNLWHLASGQKKFRQNIRNMFKFCSYLKTLKTNFIGYVKENYQRLVCYSVLLIFYFMGHVFCFDISFKAFFHLEKPSEINI